LDFIIVGRARRRGFKFQWKKTRRINYDSGKRKFELKSFLTAKVAGKKQALKNVFENKTISLTIKVNRQIYLHKK
jgi:hypothetical protein